MKRDKGFTLIEVIVSIALIGIILVGILPVMAQGLIFLNKTKEITQDVFSAQQMMELAIESAKDHTSGLAPKSVTLFPGYDIVVPYYEVVNVYENKKYVTMVSEARPAEYEALNLTGVKAIANNDVTLKVVPSSSGNQIDGEHDIVTHPDFYRNIYQWYISKPGYNMPYPATQIPEAEVGTIYPVFPYDYQALPLGYDVKRLSDLSAFSGRHVVFSATPASIKGKLGPLVSSNPILVVGYPDITNLLLHLDASLIDVSNANEAQLENPDIYLKSWINLIDKNNKFQGSNSERPKIKTNLPKTDFIGRYIDFDAGTMRSVNGFNDLTNKNLFLFAVVKGNANGIIDHNGAKLNAIDPAEGMIDNQIIQLGNGWKIVMTNYISTNDNNYKSMTIGDKDINIAEIMAFHSLTSDGVDEVINYLKNKYKIYVPVTDIVDLHNIEHEVFRGDVYTLPSSVLATFLDGTTRYVAVTWPDLTYAPGGIVDTSAVRTILYTGQSVDSPSEKVTLRVKVKPVLIFDSLSIGAITQPLAIGDHPVLTYAYTPALGTVESVKWQSSKPSVATIGVSSGEVTALTNGKTTITLTINGVNITTYELNVYSSQLPVTTGLVLHLSASEASNFEIGSGAISKWLDLSGKGNDFTQSDSNSRPKLENKLVKFTSNDFLVKSGNLSGVEFFTSNNKNFTMFLIAQANTPSNNWGTLISNYVNGSTSYWFGKNSSGQFEHATAIGDRFAIGGDSNLNLFTISNENRVLKSSSNNGNAVNKTFRNGASAGEKIFIGAVNNGTTYNLNGGIGEIIVYDRVLNDAEIKMMNSYLSNLYFPRQWEFSVEGDFIGSAAIYDDVDKIKIDNGVLSGRIRGLDPRITSVDNLNIHLGSSKKIKISLKNQSASTKAQIYFSTIDSPVFGEDKVVTFDIQKNSGLTEYTVDFSANAKWNGILKRLRIDPATSVSSGTFEIDYIKITE